MKGTEVEVQGEKYMIRKLTGFELSDAIKLEGASIGNMYLDLIYKGVITPTGGKFFKSKDEIKALEYNLFVGLGRAVYKLNTEEIEDFQD